MIFLNQMIFSYAIILKFRCKITIRGSHKMRDGAKLVKKNDIGKKKVRKFNEDRYKFPLKRQSRAAPKVKDKKGWGFWMRG